MSVYVEISAMTGGGGGDSSVGSDVTGGNGKDPHEHVALSASQAFLSFAPWQIGVYCAFCPARSRQDAGIVATGSAATGTCANPGTVETGTRDALPSCVLGAHQQPDPLDLALNASSAAFTVPLASWSMSVSCTPAVRLDSGKLRPSHDT